MRIQDVVSVEYKKTVVGIDALFLINPFQRIIQGVSLTHLNMIKSPDYFCAVLFRALCRSVGAVVRDYIDGNQFLGIILFPDAFQETADDRLLISGRISTAYLCISAWAGASLSFLNRR